MLNTAEVCREFFEDKKSIFSVLTSEQKEILKSGLTAYFFKKGDYKKAIWYFKMISYQYPNDLFLIYWLIESYLQTNKIEDADILFQRLTSSMTVNKLFLKLKEIKNHRMEMQINKTLFEKYLHKKINVQ